MCSFTKTSCSLLALILVLGMIEALPAKSSRQQAAAPYPSAEELKPEVPFEEGVLDQTYGPPDLTYGPPPTDAVEQLPSDEEPQDFTPDPDAEEVQPVQQDSLARLTNLGRLPSARGLVFLSRNPLRILGPSLGRLPVAILG
ncbi:hypothetical protein KR032_012072 [Drosophila birchii]|nr:hypothetical protein KR032_012072 [Drosophila birchii]